MARRLFVANRGEIAVRVLRAARELGLEGVAAVAKGDERSLHVRFADRVQPLKGDDPRQAFLDIEGVVAAAKASGADALHPGYGFLSENPDFARRVEEEGIAFVGPLPATMEQFGVKTVARNMAKEAGAPVIPGSDGPAPSADAALQAARKAGFPVLLKASYGGGGRGIRIVRDEGALAAAFEAATSEATAAFGRGEVYVEKFLEQARHIEVQIVGDGRGRAVHFFERDCSMQRRNQKLIEESPAPNLDGELRKRILEDALHIARAGRYRSAGTVEFLVAGGKHYFIEVNARLQVEHPVSEAVTGFDLVRLQLQLTADAQALPLQDQIHSAGHAIECRINAEDPRQGFLPTPGRITRFEIPGGPGVRVDAAGYAGGEVSPHFDSLLAKLIVHADDRAAAIRRMERALSEFRVGGVLTTIPFHSFAMASAPFRRAAYSTSTVGELGAPPPPPQEDRDAAAIAAVAAQLLAPSARLPVRGKHQTPIEMRGSFPPGRGGWFHEL